MFYFRSGSFSICEANFCHNLDLQNSPVNFNLHRPQAIAHECAHSHNKVYALSFTLGVHLLQFS